MTTPTPNDVAPGHPPLDWHALGAGPPIVLVHGALADRRLWDRHLPRLAAAGLRAIAVTLPHHGPQPDAGDARPFGLRAHTDALAAFIDTRAAGPVHLVAWSYAAHAALTLAFERPALLRSVFVYEPGMPTFLQTPQDQQAFAEDVQALFGPVAAAVAGGDLETALVHLIDGSASRPGHFAAQAAATRQIERDNVHTLPLLLQQTPPPPLTAADLAAITVRTCVAAGERTRPAYGVVSRAAQAALPAHAVTVPGAGHMWPDEDPDAFCDAVLAFVAGGRPHVGERRSG
ncbi:alpha/beta fold hydrolase [Rubrivivax sp. RP6-9]|uniref:alpha/beta fold hydrolase n=1 Tax=Rubrivivax sp. RP6-9 TaxID=3415750 RepID=UPI003CC68175